MKKYNRVMAVILAAMLMVSLVACGTNDTMAPVAEENATVAPATEGPTKEEVEVDSNATYVEVNGLGYEESSAVSTNGVLYVGDDIETLQVIDVNFEITNVMIEDAENGKKTVTIEQMAEGYIWSDGNTFATNLNIPVARLADAYSGVMIPVGNEDAVTTELKWKDNTYTVSAVETTSWEDDDWNDGWYKDPNGDGERLSSTLKIKTVVTMDDEYDGLVLVLTPITDTNGSVDGDYIMDVWTNDSYLFNINDMSANFVADEEEAEESETAETVEESTEETVEEDTKVEETKTTEPTATTTPKEEHKHSYTSTDSPSSCTVAGIRTYTCTSCGYSYTENLGTTAHDFSVPITQTVHHDEVYQTVPRTIKVTIMHCACGYTSTNEEEYQAHCVASIKAGNLVCGSSDWYEDTTETVYDYVKVSDAYDSEEIVGYQCSICGQQK